MTMVEKFEEIFWQVGDENGVNEWYNIFDSDLFDVVRDRIVNEFGDDVLESDEFLDWYDEMYEDL